MGHECATLPLARGGLDGRGGRLLLADGRRHEAAVSQLSHPGSDFLRGAASLPFVLVWVLVSAGPRSLVPRRWGLHLLRGALGLAMIGCFVFALRDLPLSTAYTIYSSLRC